MRFLKLLGLFSVLGFSTPQVYAYPEYPAFEQTGFAEDYGMFRWSQNCWWRVVDPYIYLLCGSGDAIRILYPNGAVSLATETDLPMLPRFRRTGRLTPAPGDGYLLSDVYGGRRTGVSRFDGAGNRIAGDDSNNIQPALQDDRTGIFDRKEDRFGGARMHDVFYKPIGLFSCTSIHDSIDGGIFGPIPCTSYPGVFGPKVEYGRAK